MKEWKGFRRSRKPHIGKFDGYGPVVIDTYYCSYIKSDVTLFGTGCPPNCPNHSKPSCPTRSYGGNKT